MQNQTDKADDPFGEGSAHSPVGLGAPPLEQKSQDIEILFGNDLEIRPKSRDKSLNMLKKR